MSSTTFPSPNPAHSSSKFAPTLSNHTTTTAHEKDNAHFSPHRSKSPSPKITRITTPTRPKNALRKPSLGSLTVSGCDTPPPVPSLSAYLAGHSGNGREKYSGEKNFVTNYISQSTSTSASSYPSTSTSYSSATSASSSASTLPFASHLRPRTPTSKPSTTTLPNHYLVEPSSQSTSAQPSKQVLRKVSGRQTDQPSTSTDTLRAKYPSRPDTSTSTRKNTTSATPPRPSSRSASRPSSRSAARPSARSTTPNLRAAFSPPPLPTASVPRVQDTVVSSGSGAATGSAVSRLETRPAVSGSENRIARKKSLPSLSSRTTTSLSSKNTSLPFLNTSLSSQNTEAFTSNGRFDTNHTAVHNNRRTTFDSNSYTPSQDHSHSHESKHHKSCKNDNTLYDHSYESHCDEAPSHVYHKSHDSHKANTHSSNTHPSDTHHNGDVPPVPPLPLSLRKAINAARHVSVSSASTVTSTESVLSRVTSISSASSGFVSSPEEAPSHQDPIDKDHKQVAETDFYRSTDDNPQYNTTSNNNNDMPRATVPSVLSIGDEVEVPGPMWGTVRFVGAVDGKKGVFVGVELHPEWVDGGKNSGEVGGKSYFETTIPGAGIFLPVQRAIRVDTTPTTPHSQQQQQQQQQQQTPTANLRASVHTTTGSGTHNAPSSTTPAASRFSQSVGPGRASSPLVMKKPRMSLSRPESPHRVASASLAANQGRLHASTSTSTPNRPSLSSPNRPSLSSPLKSQPGSRLTSPSGARVVSTVGEASRRLGQSTSANSSKRSLAAGPRSVSSLSQHTGYEEDRPGPRQPRPSSQLAGDEVDRLRAQLEDRDRQLQEQAASLTELTNTLSEFQALVEKPNGQAPAAATARRSSLDDKDTAQLRALLREKNDMIAQLTGEFDAHRADFRSTIDALEMASTETVRVYEAQKKDLLAEIQELEARLEDVEAVARQLKQLEELVQELEEGLEDARRGEAEARGEVEFLRGEVERAHAELRRERDKRRNDAPPPSSGGVEEGDDVASRDGWSRRVEEKDDEIRGLKAIIQSLSRGSGPIEPAHELRAQLDAKIQREAELERELAALRNDGETHPHHHHRPTTRTRTSFRDSRESFQSFRSAGRHRSQDTTAAAAARRAHRISEAGVPEVSDETSRAQRDPAARAGMKAASSPSVDDDAAAAAASARGEDDDASTASALYCEMCDAHGHDILTCTNMFGDDAAATSQPSAATADHDARRDAKTDTRASSSDVPAPLTIQARDRSVVAQDDDGVTTPVRAAAEVEDATPTAPNRGGAPGVSEGEVPGASGPLRSSSMATSTTTTTTTTTMTTPPAAVAKALPNPMEFGPVAGKESGVIDEQKWCALCERDGHDSVDCPFEEAF